MSEDQVVIEVSGLALYTHHGVTDAEQEVGQPLVIDVRLEREEVGALSSDDVSETVDYGEVSFLVAKLATERSFRTLEALLSMIADALITEFSLATVWIRATKPAPPIPLSMDGVSVELHREAS